MASLINDTARFALVDPKVQCSAKGYVAEMFMGLSGGPHAISPQWTKAVKMSISCKAMRGQLAEQLVVGTFQWWFESLAGFTAFGLHSINYMCSTLLLSNVDIVLGVQGSKLL